MTSADIALVAALGASALTGLASLGVVWFQEWRRGKASDEDALRASVQELLSRSMAVAMRARSMGETMRLRSGLKEGFDVAMRHRKLVDPLELHDWMAQDLVPLNAALTEIWTRDNQEGIRLANDVVNKSMDLLGASITRQQADGSWERLRRWAAGERWTAEMIAEYNRAMQEFAQARKRRTSLCGRPNRWTATAARLPSRRDRGVSARTILGAPPAARPRTLLAVISVRRAVDGPGRRSTWFYSRRPCCFGA